MGATADTGQLTYADCLSSDTDVTACASIPGAGAAGAHTPMTTLYGIAVSPDGADLYAVSGIGSAVTQFRREPTSGALSFASCITSNSAVNGCLELPDAAFAGSDTSLGGLRGVALSPDGASVYVAGEHSDAVSTFSRNPGSGALAFQGCISSNSDVAGCAHIPGSVADGTNTALNGLRGIAVSPDGRTVYAASSGGDGVASFARDPAGGALTYSGCISSNSNVTGCSLIPGAAANGTNTGLASVYAVAVSPDGKSLYAAAYDGNGVARFDRDPGGGLSYRDCLTSSTAVAGCTAVPGATPNADNTNLGNAISLQVSADGKSVFVVGEYSAALTRFERNPATGALTQRQCLTTNTNASACTPLPGAAPGATDTLLEYAESVVASADGNNVYVASYSGSVARFGRDPISGELAFTDCLTFNSDVAGCTALPGGVPNATKTPFQSLSSLALSPDGRNLYGGAEASDAVSRLQRELPSNQFSFGKPKRNKRKGTAKLPVSVPGQGTLELASKALKPAAKTVQAAGAVTLLVKAKGKKAKKLRRRGKLKVRAAVTYAPVGGTPNTRTKKVKLIRRR